MRLIDADELDMYDCLKSYYGDAWRDAQEEIENSPTIDAVPVVRCKDCVYCSSLFTVCTYNGRCEPVNADDFCSMGERK